MFFKRASKDKANDAGPDVAAVNGPTPPSSTATPGAVAGLDFKTTAELEPECGVLGQEKALKSILFGVEMKGPGFNVFVSGPSSCGMRSAVRDILAQRAAEAAMAFDWIYVTNFEDHNRPRALKLPAGRAKVLAKAMAACINELRATLPAAFQSEDTQSRRRSIDEEFRSRREGALEALNQKAAAQNIAILRTPSGYALAPMHEGKVVKIEVFNQIPEAMRQQVEARVEALQRELEKILAAEPKAEQARRLRLLALNEEVARFAADAAFGDVKSAFADLTEVATHLASAEADLICNAAVFVAVEHDADSRMRLPIEMAHRSPFRRYLVNLLVAGLEKPSGVPVHEEAGSTTATLIGSIAPSGHAGVDGCGVLSIHPGALHRANGGYLMLDGHDLLSAPAAWTTLKQALNTQRIAIGQLAEFSGSLEPEPIPLDVKAIVFGNDDMYEKMNQQDPDLGRMFQVRAEFVDRIESTAENHRAFARLIAGVVKRHGLRAVDAAGVAGVIAEAARMTGTPDKISVDMGRISDVVCEANHWAGKAGRQIISREDVVRAVEERAERTRGLTGQAPA